MKVWLVTTSLMSIALLTLPVQSEARSSIMSQSSPDVFMVNSNNTDLIHKSVLTSSPSFLDDLDSYNTTLWEKADGWTNGAPFWNGWRADHVEFASGIMSLRLDDQPCPAGCSGQPYASGEYRSRNFYGYGRIEGRFKAAKGDGIVSSLFTYTGPTDGNPHDEIDIEILGKDTTKMQVNYYANGVGDHETLIDLRFDASLDFHTYAFEWSPTTIKWYVDGKLVHTEDGSGGPLPTTPGKIMMNLWPGTGVDDWLNPFVYPGSPIYAYYDWVRYTRFHFIYLPIIIK